MIRQKKQKVTLLRARSVLKEIVNIVNKASVFDSVASKKESEIAIAFRDVITFIRGPDSDKSAKIKEYTTALVRERMGITFHSGMNCNGSASLESVKLTEAKLPDSGEWTPHHKEHYNQALLGLERLKLLKPGDKIR